jgi:hypothetical protein
VNPLFAQLALDWLDAERHADPERWPNAMPKRDDMTVAIDRVYQVITGNVLWSEASPGDKAIWKSRVEDIPTFARSWNRTGKPKKGGDRTVPGADDPYNQVTPRQRRPRQEAPRYQVWWNYYDTLRVSQSSPTRLFRDAKIGNPFLTNLQVAGQIARDSWFAIHRMYVAISSLEALHGAADRVLFRVNINQVPGPHLFLRDLFRGIDLTEKPTVVQARMSFEVLVELRGDRRDPGWQWGTADPFDLTFHVEGIEAYRAVV